MSKHIRIVVLILTFASSEIRCQNYFGLLAQTACEGNNLTLQCSEGYAIDVIIANYGRTASGYLVCPKYTQDWNVLCVSSNTTSYLRQQCNDRNTCTIPASSSILGDPCKNTYKYLQATYSCQKYERTCENSTMNITCTTGRSIFIATANYGRTLPLSEFSCSSDFQSSSSNTNCKAPNSLMTVSTECNYKNSCSIPVSNTKFGDPCPGISKYLQVTYYCL